MFLHDVRTEWLCHATNSENFAFLCGSWDALHFVTETSAHAVMGRMAWLYWRHCLYYDRIHSQVYFTGSILVPSRFFVYFLHIGIGHLFTIPKFSWKRMCQSTCLKEEWEKESKAYPYKLHLHLESIPVWPKIFLPFFLVLTVDNYVFNDKAPFLSCCVIVKKVWEKLTDWSNCHQKKGLRINLDFFLRTYRRFDWCLFLT